MNADVEIIEDLTELAQVRRQARMVQVKALLAAMPLTLAALMLPQRLPGTDAGNNDD